MSLVLVCQAQLDACGTLEAGLDWGLGTYATLAYGPGHYEHCDNDRLGQAASNALAKTQCASAKAVRDQSRRKSKYACQRLAR